MRIGSLFSGIGGLELGLERGLRAGGVDATVAWQCEIDPFCRKVLARHWPNAARYEDVVGLEPPAVDLICGGFPCQDISLAGKGAGIAEGTRSGLWAEYARIIGLVRPRFVVVENVAAMRNRGLAAVLGQMAALGYDAWWDCLPAESVGAPHRRDRLYMVAWRISDAERNGLRIEPERGEGAAQAGDSWDNFAVYVGAQVEAVRAVSVLRSYGRSVGSADDGGACLSAVQGWPPRSDDVFALGRMPAWAQPGLCGTANGAPGRMDRLRSLGNAVVPQVAEVLGRAIAEAMR